MWKLIYLSGKDRNEISGNSKDNVIEKYKKISASGFGYEVLELYDEEERKVTNMYYKQKQDEYENIIKEIAKAIKLVEKSPIKSSGIENIKKINAKSEIIKRLRKEFTNTNSNVNVEFDYAIFISATDEYIRKCGY